MNKLDKLLIELFENQSKIDELLNFIKENDEHLTDEHVVKLDEIKYKMKDELLPEIERLNNNIIKNHKKNIQIIVAGETANGKSTMALLLEKILKENGFDVEMNLDNEIIDYGNEMDFRKNFSANFDERKEYLKQNTKIKISQKQLARQPLQNN